MLITRVAFDLLRAPSFRDAAAAYIQRKLDQLRYPAYIGPLKVSKLLDRCHKLTGLQDLLSQTGTMPHVSWLSSWSARGKGSISHDCLVIARWWTSAWGGRCLRWTTSGRCRRPAAPSGRSSCSTSPTAVCGSVMHDFMLSATTQLPVTAAGPITMRGNV